MDEVESGTLRRGRVQDLRRELTRIVRAATPDEVCGTLNTHCTEFVNFWDRTASLSTMELSKRKGALEVCLR